MINNLPAMWETWVRSLDWEDPLEQSMATHSIVLAWRNSMDRGAWRATVRRVAKSQTRLSDSAHRSFHSHLEALFSSLSIPRWQPTPVSALSPHLFLCDIRTSPSLLLPSPNPTLVSPIPTLNSLFFTPIS